MKDKPEEYWKHQLSPEQYRVLREGATEPPGTGDLLHNKEDGTYHCAACGQLIFTSDTKFDSGSGWPSFYDVAENQAVELKDDTSLGMRRTEVVCLNCGSHLGHVFPDGPQPTGQRYCINSVALDFKVNKAG